MNNIAMTGKHYKVSIMMAVKSALIFFAFGGIFLFKDSEFFQVLQTSFVSAYLSVSVFVGATLFIFYGLKHAINFDIGDFNKKNPGSQIPVSVALGMLPGCGGAIIVLTQFVKGQVSFGAVIAVLVATMGDAAFLLIAAQPATAAFVIGTSGIVGIITGYIVNAIHDPDFLRPKIKKIEAKKIPPSIEAKSGIFHIGAAFIMLPGLFLGVLMAFQYTIDGFFENLIGLAGAFSLFVVWVLLKGKTPASNYAAADDKRSLIKHCIDDTAFITVWVVISFVLFEICVVYLGLDLKGFLSTAGVFLPLMAVLVGFIPGCGPQIIVTTLYLNGFIPLSAQVANAISNDGDALFPAIAIAPKAAIYATLYSGIPALLIGYVFYFTIG